MTRVIFAGALALLLASGASAVAQDSATPPTMQKPVAPPAAAPPVAAMPATNDYSDVRNWLCLPGRSDACAADESATVVAADGTLTREDFHADPNAPIDCFYVYPTISEDPGGNSGMVPGPGEIGAVHQQFARFGEVCKTYAPLYRQVTTTALRAMLAGRPGMGDRELAYNDVRDAWNYYLAHYNKGRGVVLIGHSQGSMILTALIKHEIEGRPVQKQLVSALLTGTRLAVPKGGYIGGDFKTIPLCGSQGQTGCAIAYASYRATVPPPPASRLDSAVQPGMQTACVNPATVGGQSGPLHAYLPSRGIPLMGALPPGPWAAGKTVDTPFVSVPGLLTASCAESGGNLYLAVTVHGDRNDPRTDDITGDVIVGGKVQADWGLHLLDMQLAMGNLIEIVRAQTVTYLAPHK